MTSTKKLWIALAALLFASFATLLWTGGEIYREAPPMPERVVSTDGDVIYTRADIELGRQVWQSMGGMQLGSIWGHGAYVAPDWSADWLHREAVGILDIWARRDGGAPSYDALSEEQRRAFQGRLQARIRKNSYDATSQTITLGVERAAAIASVVVHYQSLFGKDPATVELRKAYAMKNDTVPNPEYRRALTAFFWWTAWATVTERPGQEITYTNNWPGEPLVGNTPPASLFLWSAFSVVLLLAGVALLGWHHAVTAGRHNAPHKLPVTDPMSKIPACRGKCPSNLPAHHRCRSICRAVVRSHAEAWARIQLLVWPPGMGIHRYRPLLAMVLFYRADVVAGTSLGRGLLRSLCYRGARHSFHAPRAVASKDCNGRGAVRYDRVHGRRCAWDVAPSVFRRYADSGDRAGCQLFCA